MKTLAQIGQSMVSILNKRKEVEDPRYRGGQLSWLLDCDGWITPVWTHLTFYSDTTDIVRFRNDLVSQLPKSQWPYQLPKQFRFELTAALSELDRTILTEVVEYCELARRNPKSKFDRHPTRFPMGADHGGYGWTERAWKTQTERTK